MKATLNYNNIFGNCSKIYGKQKFLNKIEKRTAMAEIYY
jgi:hypothetical protein